ncbi:MAG: MOSC domain-containing protein [Gammaproteobacteria bacterium]|jgi:MOSC domain-containing protein YiiM
MQGRLVSILAAESAGAPLRELPDAQLQAGRGLVGDRYYRRNGTFSQKLAAGPDWEITLIELEEIDRFNAARATPLTQAGFRRNLVTRNVRLNELVETRFRVGGAELEGLRLCEPCAYLGSLLGPEVVREMAHKAGLRARILNSAVIRCGDPVLTAGSG